MGTVRRGVGLTRIELVGLLGGDVGGDGREVPAIGVEQSVPVDVVPALELADDVTDADSYGEGPRWPIGSWSWL